MTEALRDNTYTRLMEAAAQKKVIGPSQVARALDASYQAVTNWKVRGVPISAALVAQKLWGVSAQWIASGEGPMWLPADFTGSSMLEGATSHAAATVRPSVAQALEALAGAMANAPSQEDLHSATELLQTFVRAPARNMDLISLISKRLDPKT